MDSLLEFKRKYSSCSKNLTTLLTFSFRESAENECMIRSSSSQMFFKICVIKSFSKLAENFLCGSLFFNELIKLQDLQFCEKRDSGTDIFRWILWNIQELLFYRKHSNISFCWMSAFCNFLIRKRKFLFFYCRQVSSVRILFFLSFLAAFL